MNSLMLISNVLLALGSLALILGVIGLNRFPDFFSRTHAASVTDTAGAGLILIGLMLQAGWSLILAKLLFVLFFLLISSPTATHALAQAALADGAKPQLGNKGR